MNETMALDQDIDVEKLIGEARSNYIGNNPESRKLYEDARNVMPGAPISCPG